MNTSVVSKSCKSCLINFSSEEVDIKILVWRRKVVCLGGVGTVGAFRWPTEWIECKWKTWRGYTKSSVVTRNVGYKLMEENNLKDRNWNDDQLQSGPMRLENLQKWEIGNNKNNEKGKQEQAVDLYILSHTDYFCSPQNIVTSTSWASRKSSFFLRF